MNIEKNQRNGLMNIEFGDDMKFFDFIHEHPIVSILILIILLSFVKGVIDAYFDSKLKAIDSEYQAKMNEIAEKYRFQTDDNYKKEYYSTMNHILEIYEKRLSINPNINNFADCSLRINGNDFEIYLNGSFNLRLRGNSTLIIDNAFIIELSEIHEDIIIFRNENKEPVYCSLQDFYDIKKEESSNEEEIEI